jgi:hypothetical protein
MLFTAMGHMGSLDLLDIGEVAKLRHSDALQKVADTTLKEQGPILDVAYDTRRWHLAPEIGSIVALACSGRATCDKTG